MRISLGILLGSTYLSRWSPNKLFTASEAGVWLDPSDLTTMFQDINGLVPVTSPGQPVALVLDKSKGLVTGPELVPNSTFDTDTGWNKGLGWTISGGAGRSAGGNPFAALTAFVSTTTGFKYILSFDVALTSGSILVRFGGGTNVALITTSGSYRYIATAESSGNISFLSNGSGNEFVGSIDNVSIKLLAGHHAIQTTAASRPIYGIEPPGGRRNLLTYTSAIGSTNWGSSHVVTLNAALAPDGTMTMTRANPATTVSNIFQNVTLIQNTTYRLSIYAQAGTSTRSRFSLYDNSGADVQGELNVAWSSGVPSQFSVGGSATGATFESVGGGTYRISVTITSDAVNTAHRFQWYSDTVSATGTTFIWGAQLEAGSTTTNYQKVTDQWNVTEAGKASVSYLAFDGVDDSLVTPTITPTSDKSQVFIGIRKLSDATSGVILEYSTNSATATGSLGLFGPLATTTGEYAARSRGAVASTATTLATFAAPVTNLLTSLNDISGDSVLLRANGVQAASSTADQGVVATYLPYQLYIGRRGGTELPFNGRIYNLVVRFGPNLSADQISKTEVWMGGKTGFYKPIISGSPVIS